MSPRAVSPQTWRHALAEHGPKEQSVLLTLHTIGVHMDREGRAWPNEETIARGARTSVRTVQRHIKVAKRDGWIGVELSEDCTGRDWRHNVYRAAVPDHLDLKLNRKAQIAADAITAKWGRIGGDTQMSSPEKKADDTQMSSPRPPVTQRRNAGVTTNQKIADDKRDHVVTTDQLLFDDGVTTPGCRTKCFREVIGEVIEDEAHSAQSRGERDNNTQHALRKMETRTRTYTREELHKRVQAYHEAQMQPDDIVRACLQGASPADIRQALQDCGLPHASPQQP